MRRLNMLFWALLDDSERFLAAYQKFNTIRVDSESDTSSSSDNDDPYKKIPKLFSKRAKKENHDIRIDKFLVRFN